MSRTVWNFIYSTCVVIEVTAVGVLLINAVIDETDLAKLPGFLKPFTSTFAELKEMTGLVSFCTALALIAAEVIKRWIGPKWIWEAIDTTVDELRDRIFNTNKTTGSPSHHHRVTLFQCRRWLWRRLFCSFWRRMSWLVVASRSGRVTQVARVIWAVSDVPEKCDGFAGKAWLHDGLIDKRIDYPVGIEDPASVNRYSTDTFVAPNWVEERLRRKKQLPMRIAAVVLEVNGEPWGVIVIDSVAHDSLKHDYKDDVDRAVSALKHLLQGV